MVGRHGLVLAGAPRRDGPHPKGADRLDSVIGRRGPAEAGKTLAVMQISGGSQSFNAVNQMRMLGRWMRMLTIPDQSSVAKAVMEFDEAGRMKPSAYFDRVVVVMKELVKFTLLTRYIGPYLVDRYSERKESAAAIEHEATVRPYACVWLLTTSASDFSERHGYSAVATSGAIAAAIGRRSISGRNSCLNDRAMVPTKGGKWPRTARYGRVYSTSTQRSAFCQRGEASMRSLGPFSMKSS